MHRTDAATPRCAVVGGASARRRLPDIIQESYASAGHYRRAHDGLIPDAPRKPPMRPALRRTKSFWSRLVLREGDSYSSCSHASLLSTQPCTVGPGVPSVSLDLDRLVSCIRNGDRT